MKTTSWAACAWVAAIAAPALSQEVSGVVERVRGTAVTIRLASGSAEKGDTVRFSDDIEGVGRVNLKGTWIVASVDGSLVVAEADGRDVGAPQAGMRAAVTTKRPPGVGGAGKPLPTPLPPPPRGGKTGLVNREATTELRAAIRNDVDGARMRRLVAAGADVNAGDEHGYTVLMEAARRASTDVLNALLDGRPALDAQTHAAKSEEEVGQTALMEAVSVGNRQNVAALLARKPSLDLKRKNGDSALLIAVRNGDEAITRVLLDAGASIDVINQMAETARSIAGRIKHERIAAMLDDVLKRSIAEQAFTETNGWVRRRPASGGFRVLLPPEYAESQHSSQTIKLLYDTSKVPSSPLRVARVSFDGVPAGQSLAGRRDAVMADLRAKFQKFEAKAPMEGQLSGVPSSGFRYTYEWEGTPVEAVVHVMLRDGGAYEITLACRADRYESLRPEFRSILASFAFE